MKRIKDLLGAVWAIIRGGLEVMEEVVSLAIGLFFGRIMTNDSMPIYRFLDRKRKLSVQGLAPLFVSNSTQYIKSAAEWRSVFYTNKQRGSALFLYRGAPVFFWQVNGNPTFFWLRGTVDWKRMLKESGEYADMLTQQAKERRKDQEVKVTQISGGQKNTDEAVVANAPTETDIEYVGYEQEDVGNPESTSLLADMAKTDKVNELVTDVLAWYRRREWYQDRNIPWKRGYHLTGKPGTGKTTLTRAIGQHLGMKVYRLALPTLSDGEFQNQWNNLRGNERIVILEDIDRVDWGMGNEQVEPDDGSVPPPSTRVYRSASLSLDTVLNCIDGLDRDNGLLLFLTSNHPDKVPEALGRDDGTGRSTRPGRVDMFVKMPDTMDEAGRYKIAQHILLGDEAGQEIAVKGGDSDTPAQFVERCIRLALEREWFTSNNLTQQAA